MYLRFSPVFLLLFGLPSFNVLLSRTLFFYIHFQNIFCVNFLLTYLLFRRVYACLMPVWVCKCISRVVFDSVSALERENERENCVRWNKKRDNKNFVAEEEGQCENSS